VPDFRGNRVSCDFVIVMFAGALTVRDFSPNLSSGIHYVGFIRPRVPLGQAEQGQDLLGGGPPALALLRIDGQLLDLFAPAQ
jgi:hypothetical protein